VGSIFQCQLESVFGTKNFQFHFQGSTDGVSFSVHRVNRRWAPVAGKPGGMKLPKDAKFKELYVKDIPQVKKQEYVDGKVAMVAGDPGMRDMAYWRSEYKTAMGEIIEAASRFTSCTRSVGIHTKRYAKIRKKKKKEFVAVFGLIDGKTIEQLETAMSQYNSKTLDFDNFLRYLGAKNLLNHQLFPFYRQQLLRKLRFGSYIGKQITEARMARRMREVHLPRDENGKLVGPTELFVCIGNWSKTNRKYFPSTQGIGNRRAMRHQHLNVFLVDERNTSCRCHFCGAKGTKSRTEKFRKVKNPRYNPKNPNSRKFKLCHGLVRCPTCGMLMNRDDNGSRNILRIAEAAMRGECRPLDLQDAWTDNFPPPKPPPQPGPGQIAGLS